MAGDWIKMRGNLWDDPRVGKLCDLTDCTEAMVIGGLYWLWATADQHTEDGVMPGLSLQGIDRKSGIRGFGEALCSVGWLADHPEGVRIVKFEEHNGASAKKRCQTAKRVAIHKSANAPVTQEDEKGNAGSVSGALPREEKRREEKKSKENKFSSDDMATAEFIWEGVQRLNPTTKPPKLDAWAASVRRMREIDSRPDGEIRALFTWANQHRFWAANVLSPDKLREQYDRLTAQRNQESQNAANQPIPFNRAASARKPVIDHDDTSWIEAFSDPNRL